MKRAGNYIIDDRDNEEAGELQGSILGFRTNITINRTNKITALLFVSTFDKKFTYSANVKNIKNNIRLILSQFEPRMRIELLNLYKDQQAP